MKKNRILIFGAGTALILAMFVGCSGNAGEKEFGKAMKAWENGDLVQARALFEKATGRLTGNARKSEAYNDLGRVLWELDEVPAATTAFSEACTLAEAITDARLNLAMAQFYSDDLDGATKSLSIYLGQYPENRTAMTLKSLVAAKKRDWDQSSRIMAQIAVQNPNDPAVQNALAISELNQGQSSSQVINRLMRITSTNPDYAPAIYNLAVIYDQWLHDTTKATQYYQYYLQEAGATGSHSEASKKAIERLKASGTTDTSGTTQAVQYMTEGARLHGAKKYAEAVEQFKKAIQINPNQKNAYYNMGLAYYSLQKFNDAVQACQSAINIDPGFADARYMLALSYVQQKKWAYAEREAKELSKIDSKRGKELLAYIEKARK